MALARTTLANERVSMGSGSSFGGGIEALVALVAERVASGALGAGDPLLLDRLGALVSEAHAVAAIGLRATARSLSGAPPGPEASVRKLLGVEHDQRTQELGLLLLGPEGATTVGAAGQWTFGFLANRCLTIAGGTSEIQRNVIGERLLDCPGTPSPPEPGGDPYPASGISSRSWPSGSRIMMARPPMSVSASTSPPSSATRAQVAATSATVNDRWVRPGSVNDRDRAAPLPSRSKWSSSQHEALPLQVDGGEPHRLGHPQQAGRGGVGDRQVAAVREPEHVLVEPPGAGEIGHAQPHVVDPAHHRDRRAERAG